MKHDVSSSLGKENLFTSRRIMIAASLLGMIRSPGLLRWARAAVDAGADRLHFDLTESGKRRLCDYSESRSQAFAVEHVRSVATAIRTRSGVELEAHLIVAEPSESILAELLQAGATTISIHWEAFANKQDLNSRAAFVRDHGGSPFLAFCPETDVVSSLSWLKEHGMVPDGVSLSATQPGNGGGTFDNRVLSQIRAIRQFGFMGLIQVDGGIEASRSAPLARDAGADILVSGSALFGSEEGRSVALLTRACQQLRGSRSTDGRAITPSRSIPDQNCMCCDWSSSGLDNLTQCPNCGSSLQFVHHDQLNFLSYVDDRPGMWRYNRMMPVCEGSIISVGEGMTPVVYSRNLSERLGVNIYLKLETSNPTGTFKDREASFVISRSVAAGKTDLVLQSTGNTAIAVSYFATQAGCHSYAFLPARNSYKLIGPPLGDHNYLVLVDGEPADVKRTATLFSEALGFYKISPFHHRSEANVTTAYELGESILNHKLPNFDFLVQTIAAGMGPIGIGQGMLRLARWTSAAVVPPRLLGVEISEFAPLHKAWTEGHEPGLEADTPCYGVTKPYEPTLHTTNARPYYNHLYRTLRATNGDLIKVEPWESQEAEPELRSALQEHGVELSDTENSSFIAYAGLKKKIREGWISPGTNVLLIISGKAIHGDHIQLHPSAVIAPDFDPWKLLNSLNRREETAHAA